MAEAYDCIIIGAGINGLVTAAVLARAGLKVVVLERRQVAGGSAVVEEIHPGFRVAVCAHDAGWLNPEIAHDLQLARHGLEFVQTDLAVCAPLPDGDHLTLWCDAGKTAQEMRRFSKSDAEKWPAFNTRRAKLAGFLESVYTITIPPITTTRPGDAFLALGLGRRLRGLGKPDMLELLRWLPMSAYELLSDWFESDALKGALGASGITGLMQGPRSGGTAFMMLHDSLGRMRAEGRGMKNLVPCLQNAAQQHGAEIRLGAEVGQIMVKHDRAIGVALTRGEGILARRVISSADPKRTFLDLVDPLHFEPHFVQAVQRIKYRGVFAKVNLALSELPKFKGVDESHLHGAMVIAPHLDYLERAYDDAKYGQVSREPYLHAVIPSLADPSLAPPGQHVMSIWMQYAPYRLKEGVWDAARREALGDRVIDTLAQYAPNMRAAIIHRQVLTPLDVEHTFGLTEGHPYHGELTLDQILFMRPVPGWAQYRTPIDRLYLCGAGTHPGGGIAGGSGFNAAREILKDVKSRT